MPLCDVFLRSDLLVNVLEAALLDAKMVCSLMCVNRMCRNLFDSKLGGKYWSKMAKDAAGANNWETIYPGLPNLDDPQYTAILTVCPWLSSPHKIPIYFVGHGNLYSTGRYTRDMSLNHAHWQMHCSTGEGVADSILVEAHINGQRTIFSVPIRPENQPGFVQQVFDAMPDDPSDDAGRFSRDVNRAQMLMDTNQLVPASVTGISNVSFARLHDSVDIAVQVSNQHGQSSGILFMSRENDAKLLRRVKTKIVSKPPVLFRPAELWILEDKTNSILYYGPRSVRRIQPETVTWPAYTLAQWGLGEEALAFLEQKKIPPNDVRFSRQRTLLMACIDIHFPVEVDLRAVMDATRESINVADKHDKTALFYAVSKGDTRMVEHLLERGAKITLSTFHEAVLEFCRMSAYAGEFMRAQRLDIMNRMIDGCGDIDALSIYSERNALMIAAYNGNLAGIKLLLDKGADPTFESPRGETALVCFDYVRHWADKQEGRAIRQLLGKEMRKRAVPRYFFLIYFFSYNRWKLISPTPHQCLPKPQFRPPRRQGRERLISCSRSDPSPGKRARRQLVPRQTSRLRTSCL